MCGETAPENSGLGGVGEKQSSVLEAYLFGSVEEAQDLSDQWLADYNENRPHDALGGLPPAHFLPYVPKLKSLAESVVRNEGAYGRAVGGPCS